MEDPDDIAVSVAKEANNVRADEARCPGDNNPLSVKEAQRKLT
jgi:hypothetical protein